MPNVDESAQGEEVIFKKKLKKLEQYRGRGTELISVYIPGDADRSSVTGQLSEEVSQSGNIKSPSTRKNVQGALRKILSFLRQIDFKIPKNGIVVFAGNISEVEGRTDIRLFTVKPIKDLRTKRYWCDSTFHLEPLKEMVRPSDAYGLITIDKSEATTAILVGKRYEILGHFTSGVAGKMRAGGQCLAPDTLIALSDGRLIKAEDLAGNETVKSADFETMTLTDSNILDKWETEKNETIVITTVNPKRRLECSTDHTLFVADGEAITGKIAEQITEKDRLLTFLEKGRKIVPVKIASIKSEKKKCKMVDLSIQNKNFFANGLIVHNSAARFERLREEAEQEFYKRISEKANNAFVQYGDKLQGIIVGGPGMTKNFFLEKDMLDYRIKGKVLGTIDTGYTDESGIRELVQKSDTLLKDTGLMKEKEILDRFFSELAKDALATYGEQEVMKALELGQAEKVLVSEAIEWYVYRVRKKSSGEERFIVDKDNSFDESSFKGEEQLEIVEEYEFIDYILEKASKTSAKVEIISVETPEGEQFYKGFGGLAAMLRYKI